MVKATKPTTPRRRDPERSKASILAAARDEFVVHGFQGARTNHIAKRAKVPQGLIYHYFENKEQLFDRVFDDAFAPYFEGMIQMLEDAGDTPDVKLLENSVRFYFDFLAENPHIPRLMGWWYASQRWTCGKPMYDSDRCGRLHELGELRIRQAQQVGMIKKHLEPGFVIKIFLDLCMQYHITATEFMVENGFDPNSDVARTRLDHSYLETIIEVFLDGVLTEPFRTSGSNASTN